MTLSATESGEEEAPGSISRRLGLTVAVSFILILSVGGLSSFLAWSILATAQEIPANGLHAERAESIQTTIHHLTREVHWAVIEQAPDRRSQINDLASRAANVIGTLLNQHLDDRESFPEKAGEITRLRVLEWLVQDLEGAAARILTAVEAKTGPAAKDLQVLDTVGQQVFSLTEELEELHHAKTQRLITEGLRRMKVIMGAYIAFLLVGGASVIVGVRLFSRTVAAPLRRLASATRDIATGHFGKRMPIESRDEIGQLSRSFNDMAGTLERREVELRRAQDELSRRMMESQALYRIGVEISGLLDLEKILQSVAEKARDLLQARGAALCLFRPRGDAFEVRVVRGSVGVAAQAFTCGGDGCGTSRVACHGHDEEACAVCVTVEGAPAGASLAAALRRGEALLGVLCVARKEARVFQSADRELLEALAVQASIAIENARLYKEIESLATVQERERIAREMHDGLAQALAYLHLKLGLLEERAPTNGLARIRPELGELKQLVWEAHQEVRQSIVGLRDSVSRSQELLPTLERFLRDFGAQHGIQVVLQAQDDRAPRLSAAAEAQLVRIIQGALTNVWKHAGATRAVVRVEGRGAHCEVSIHDGGCGFDPRTMGTGRPSGFGLQGMRERAERLGGSLAIESRPGEGTRVTVRLPGLPPGGREADGTDQSLAG